MLVDDEKLIIEGLMNIIEWEDIGLKVIETARNGYEALEKFKSNSVDIIVTDINMPKITGLELIKEVRKINSNTKFIILTGYDEFNYAIEAIEYSVEKYILKPIDENELQETLKNIVKDLDNKKIEINKILDKNTKLIEYIESKLNENYIYEIKESIDISTENKSYTVANIIISRKDKDGDFIKVSEIIEKYTYGEYEILHKYNDQVILINSWEKDISRDIVIKYYEEIKDKLSNESNESIFISIGDLVSDIKDLSKSYNIANNLKEYILTVGTNECIYMEKIENLKEDNISFIEEIDCINRLIIERNIKVLKRFIYEILDNKELSPKNIYDFSIKVLILIDSIANDLHIEAKYGKYSLSNSIIQICEESTRENIRSFILSEIEELIESMYMSTIKYSPIVQQIVNIINDRYDEELSLKTLAYQYNINSSYLGQIFSKETEVSFSEYLNKIRNIKAKELILNTNMKINDISKEVGYADTSYFYRKFKKYYGVSPSTLREMKNY